MKALLVLALVASPAIARADKAHDAIGVLPELGSIVLGGAHVIVRGELPKPAQHQALELVNQVIADVERRFTRPAKDGATVTVCLLPDNQRFLAVASQVMDNVPSPFGFYKPDVRIAIANWGASIGNLRHELVHPLIDDDFPGIPTWLNEGIAALYGSAKLTSHGFEFLVNYRLRDLQAALEAGTLPTIAQLAESTDRELYGPRNAVYYAMARYVLLYVDRQGKLDELYAALRACQPAQRRAVLERYIDDRSFVAWAKQLRL